MKKQILLIKDPEHEVGFDVLCEFSYQVAKSLQGEPIVVIPMWPHGEMELIGDKRKIKLITKEYKKLIEEMEKTTQEEGEVKDAILR